MQLKGIFQITDWQESTEQSFDDGSKLNTAVVCQNYRGDVTGESKLTFQMHYEPSGNAAFIGFEVLTGNIENKPCNLTIKHDGSFKEGVAKSQFVIVNSDTHKNLIGEKGEFKSTEGGQAEYVIG